MILSDVTQFIRNGANIKQEKGSSGIPITRIETISNSVFNNDRLGYADIFDDKYSEYYLQDNDVLLSHINSEKYLGRTVVYKKTSNQPIIHGMNLLCLRFNCEEYNPEYFCLYSQSPRAKAYIANNTKKSVNQASITATAIKNMPIPNVNLHVQYSVVKRLNKLQLCIDLRNKELQKLDELIKSRFFEMFGDPIANPKAWEIRPLKSITTKIGSGATPKGGKESYCDYGICLIRSMNVHNGLFEFKDLAHINNIQAEALNSVTVNKDDILLNITGASVARSCIVPNNVIPARVNQHVCIIRCIDGVNPIFINAILISKSYQHLLWEIAGSGATREAITKQQIEMLSIICPPIELQNQFADFVAKVEQQKATVQKSIDRFEALKKSLMQEYFG